jgi:hypothetical protein
VGCNARQVPVTALGMGCCGSGLHGSVSSINVGAASVTQAASPMSRSRRATWIGSTSMVAAQTRSVMRRRRLGAVASV